MNGGTCSSYSDGHYFQCACPDDYEGWTCEIPILRTTPPTLTCSNNATLSMAVCAAAPCAPGSRCLAMSGSAGEGPSYLCVCEEGWGGRHCDMSLQCNSSDPGEHTHTSQLITSLGFGGCEG